MARSRTTISIDAQLFREGQRRADALGYVSFSEYVAYLIGADLKERGKHITVREEGGAYRTAHRAVATGAADKKRSSG